MKAERFEFHATDLPGVQWIEPVVHADSRGWFLETYRARDFAEAGIGDVFVQDNESHSSKGVLRGLHFQRRHPQAKLVRCTAGVIWDVAVDMDPTSSAFGHWFGIELSAANHRELYIPGGMAHGFLALEEGSDVVYKCSREYDPLDEAGILWSDPQVAVAWPLEQVGIPVLSARDLAWPTLAQELKGAQE